MTANIVWICVPALLPVGKECEILDRLLEVDDSWPHVVALWMWAARWYRDGDISQALPAIVAKRAMWKGDPERFMSALIAADVLTPERRIVGWARTFPRSKPPRRAHAVLSSRLRFSILKRDGFACVYCGAAPPDVKLHVDHIDPVAGGGATVAQNLVTACAACNLGKAAFPLEDA